MESWIFTIIIGILVFISFAVEDVKVKIAIMIVEVIILILQIIYGFFKSR